MHYAPARVHRACAHPVLLTADKLREARIAEKEKLRAEKVQEEAGKPKQQSSKVSKKEILELKKVFDDYDKDESGAISQQEWIQVMKERKQKAEKAVGKLDKKSRKSK